MKIRLLVPTRGRPNNMEALSYNVANTSENVDIAYYIDNDDIDSCIKVNAINKYIPTRFIVGPKLGNAVMINVLYQKNQDADIFMFAGDDILFRTDRWDEVVRNEFLRYNDRILFCGGHDGCNEDIITHGFLHKKWIDKLGFVLPPQFVADYCDTWINDVARRLDRWARLNIMVEHLHWSVGKSQFDETAKEYQQKAYGSKQRSDIMYQQSEPQRLMAVKMLKELMNA